MQTFKINDNLEVVCEWVNTRNGFKHVATLLLDGREQESVKINYLNRTWEGYEFESVLKKLLNDSKFLLPEQKTIFKAKIDGQFRDDDPAMKQLNNIAGIMALGDILADGQKEANDWKLRMLKAGLDGQGLIMPDDWDDLTEAEKQRRLNGVIKTLGEV